MSNLDFAKIFNSDKYGQILLTRFNHDENGLPELHIRYIVGPKSITCKLGAETSHDSELSMAFLTNLYETANTKQLVQFIELKENTAINTH